MWSISDKRSMFQDPRGEKIPSRIAEPLRDVPLERVAEILERTLEEEAAEKAKREEDAERFLREAPSRFPRLFGEEQTADAEQ